MTQPYAKLSFPTGTEMTTTPDGAAHIVHNLAQQLSVLHCRPVHDHEVTVDVAAPLGAAIEYRGYVLDSETRSARWHMVVAKAVAAVWGENAEQWWTDFGDLPLKERYPKELRVYFEAVDWYAERSLIVTNGFQKDHPRWSLPPLAEL